MSYLLIMNPGSCSGRGKRLWEKWERGLSEAGVEYSCVMTEGIGHAVELAREAETEIVVAVGGDGTINEVLDGVMQSENSKMKMGVLYSGTSPDFCKFHGISVHPGQAVDALVSGRCRQVDVVRIAYHDASGREQVAHFGCSCNIGMGASVAKHANRSRRYLGDVIGTGTGVIGCIAKNQRVDIDLAVDGNTVSLPLVNNLTIAKNPYIASGLKLQLGIQPDDGKLAIVAVYGQGRRGLLRLLPKYYWGSATAEEGLYQARCESVSITAREPQEIEFDGDPRGYLPARIEVLPRALALIGGVYE